MKTHTINNRNSVCFMLLVRLPLPNSLINMVNISMLGRCSVKVHSMSKAVSWNNVFDMYLGYFGTGSGRRDKGEYSSTVSQQAIPSGSRNISLTILRRKSL